jgi:Leucine-rich repeat (LRR) protein
MSSIYGVKNITQDILNNIKLHIDLDIKNIYSIRNLPVEIRKLFNLEIFNCSYNSIGKLPDGMCNLINLRIINVQNNKLKKLPDEIGRLYKLEVLNCNNNKLCKLPSSMHKCNKLQTLMCSLNKLNEIQGDNLIYLNTLDCSFNNLKKLPDGMINLVDLKCNNNKLTTIPSDIKPRAHLICSNNKLQTILCDSEYICARYNNISSINVNINAHTHTLILTACNMNELYLEIFNLFSLQHLYCESNNITHVPDAIGNLVNLQTLCLSRNKITRVSDVIGRLHKLTILKLDYNRLTSLPIAIINCRFINIIYNNNAITYLPPQIVRFLQGKGIYKDVQSVHDTTIQENVRKSIEYITSIKPNMTHDEMMTHINNNVYLYTSKNLISEYVKCTDVQATLNITFSELLLSVYSFITVHKESVELYRILDTEMKDSMNLCFTGRMSRLINVINGYNDNITIYISDNEQIGNIISIIYTKMTREGWYNEPAFKLAVINELKSRGYPNNVIDEWLINI